MTDPLLSYLFDDKPHILARPMSQWLASSPRFKAFATTYRDKIRKKIRIIQGNGAGTIALEAELAIAYWLLQERRFTVAYEPYGSEKKRGPDYAVTFKSMSFNVEVTRIGSRETRPVLPAPELPVIDSQRAGGRLADTVCDKLGQMRPGMINVLVVVMDSDYFWALDLNLAMAQLRERAERKEEGLFKRHGFTNGSDFFRQYLRLSAVVVRTAVSEESTAHSSLWLNNQAKQALPGSIRAILQRG